MPGVVLDENFNTKLNPDSSSNPKLYQYKMFRD